MGTVQLEGQGYSEVVVVGAAPCELDKILLLGKTATVNVSGGIWVTANGSQVGVACVPTTIPQGSGSVDGVGLATVFGASRPPNAVGALLVIDGDLLECRGRGDATIEANFRQYPSRYLPVLALGPDFPNGFGRVG